MALCNRPSCGCAFVSESLTISQAAGLVTIEQAGDTIITELQDAIEALQADFDAYVTATNATLASHTSSLSTLSAAYPLASNTSWNPTVAGFTKGNGVQATRMLRQGPQVYCAYYFTLGSTSTVTGNISVSLPYTSVSGTSTHGLGRYVDASTQNYPIEVVSGGLGAAVFPYDVDGTNAVWRATTSTSPFTWAAGDVMLFAFTYFAA